MTDTEKLDFIIAELSDMKTHIYSMETRLDSVETEIHKTNMILENEIRVNIQRIAEGHLDLSRKLHDAMHPRNEVEMLAISLRMLESKVRSLEYKLESMA